MSILTPSYTLATLTGFLLLLNILLTSSGLLGQERRLEGSAHFIFFSSLFLRLLTARQDEYLLICTKMLDAFWEKLRLPNTSMTP